MGSSLSDTYATNIRRLWTVRADVKTWWFKSAR